MLLLNRTDIVKMYVCLISITQSWLWFLLLWIWVCVISGQKMIDFEIEFVVHIRHLLVCCSITTGVQLSVRVLGPSQGYLFSSDTTFNCSSIGATIYVLHVSALHSEFVWIAVDFVSRCYIFIPIMTSIISCRLRERLQQLLLRQQTKVCIIWNQLITTIDWLLLGLHFWNVFVPKIFLKMNLLILQTNII